MWKWADLKKFLKREATVDDLAAVMWPVVPWGATEKVDEPHCTILMLGDIRELNFTKQEVIQAIQETYHTVFIWAEVEGLEWFGENKDVPVLLLNHEYLFMYRDSLEDVLRMRGIKWDEHFPTYRPHVTVNQEVVDSGFIPQKVMLSPVELWWGKERIVIPNPDQLVTVSNA